MQSYIKYTRYYDKKAKASPLKEKDYCYILQSEAEHHGSKKSFRDFRWIGPYLVEKVLPNNNYIVRKLNTNKTQILFRFRLRKYNLENNYLETTIRKLNGRLTITSLSNKMIYTQLHGKRNLVDSYLTFLSYILILTQLILMKVVHRDQILFLSHAPTFMIQAMVKTGKLAPFLTHLYHNFQSLNRSVKVKILRPLQT